MTNPTAAMLAIGDELLSGRTKDKNIAHLAEVMAAIGIDLIEVRIVGDDQAAIVDAVNALRERATYLFTSGGIGPTHDDITADAIAAAFGVPCEHDSDAMALLERHYAATGREFTDARRRMARMPRGATHIENPVSVAPGFVVGNVHVMAGVPPVFQAMLDAVVPTLKHGRALAGETIEVPPGIGEGDLGGPLAEIDGAFPDVSIGSYPRFENGTHTVRIVLRSRDDATLRDAADAVRAMLTALDGRALPV